MHQKCLDYIRSIKHRKTIQMYIHYMIKINKVVYMVEKPHLFPFIFWSLQQWGYIIVKKKWYELYIFSFCMLAKTTQIGNLKNFTSSDLSKCIDYTSLLNNSQILNGIKLIHNSWHINKIIIYTH